MNKQDQITLKVRKGVQPNHNESALKVRQSLMLRGSLLVLTLIVGANIWLNPSRMGMQVPDGPEATRTNVSSARPIFPDAPDTVPDAPDTVPDGPE